MLRPSFEDFAAEHARALLRVAFLITGNQAAAEDLLQTCLVRLYEAWPRLDHETPPLAYARRMLYTAHVSQWRRRVREVLTSAPPERAGHRDEYAERDERDRLWRMVATLPRMQRAVILLRYYEDQDEAGIAATLGISVGTVKTHASRALARLRELDRLAGQAADREVT